MWFPSQTLFNDFMQILHMLVEVKSMEKKLKYKQLAYHPNQVFLVLHISKDRIPQNTDNECCRADHSVRIQLKSPLIHSCFVHN